jgi:excisionase family DNA binding protein
MQALINVDKAAEFLSISKHTLRGMVRRKQIRHVKIGRRCLFRQKDITEMISAGLQKPQPRRGVND